MFNGKPDDKCNRLVGDLGVRLSSDKLPTHEGIKGKLS